MPVEGFMALPIQTRAFYEASAIVESERRKAAHEKADAEAHKYAEQGGRGKRRVNPRSLSSGSSQPISKNELFNGNWANVIHTNK